MYSAAIRTTSAGLRPLLVAATAALAVSAAVAPSQDGPGLRLPRLAASAPLPIVPNAGQADAHVRYEARAPGGAVFFTQHEIVLARPAGVSRMRWLDAEPGARVRATDRGPGVVNVQRGSDAGRWRTGLPVFDAVIYQGLYRGVDVRAVADPSASTRRTFAVSAGADADSIRWAYPGAAVRVDRRTGELVVGMGAGSLREAAPVAWQRASKGRAAVAVRYRIAAGGVVGFALGRHDTNAPLWVTVPVHARPAQAAPPALRHSTFLGGAMWDEAYDVAVDRAGNAYVAGFTFSPAFPRAGARPSGFKGVVDAFVAKFNPDGRLVYSSYLGGDATDAAHGVAVDARGRAFITGRTESVNFPKRSPMKRRLGNRCQHSSPCHDAFVTKLRRNGQIAYSTYLGGSKNEEGWDVAIDRRGRAVVIGNTDSANFPTRRAVQRRYRSRRCRGDLPCPFDAFVAKLRRNGRGLVYGTYLGGRKTELASGIAVDRRGAAYVTGSTDSTDFPVRRALQRSIRGRECGPPPNVPCEEAFIAKIRPRGRRLVWSTFLGGVKPERGTAITVDRRRRPYVAGLTESADFPTAAPVQPALGNASCSAEAPPKELCHDGFVTGLSASGRRLRFSTYLGGNAEDSALGIAVDRAGAVYVGGSTDSLAFPTRNAVQPKRKAAIDAFVTKYAPAGRGILYSTYLGGSKSERASGLAVTRAGEVVLAGRTDSPDFPVANPQQPALAGDIDAFVTRLK